MGRDWSPDDREPESSGTVARRQHAAHAARRRRRARRGGLAPSGDERFLVVRWHERIVTVSPSEQGTLRTLGAYRTIAAPDLATHRYGGDRARFDREVRRLVRHGWSGRPSPPSRQPQTPDPGR